MPIDPELSKLVDDGRIEDNKVTALTAAADILSSLAKL